MKKHIVIAGITAAVLFTAGTVQAGTMTDVEFFANINDLAYDDQPLETVEFARMELGPVSDVSTTDSESDWVSIIHDPLYIDAD